jgi:NitT/TauT family transport system substrate-binding protein
MVGRQEKRRLLLEESMPGFTDHFPKILRALIVGAGTLLVAATAAHAEVAEARIGIQYGLVYLPVAVAEDRGFFAEEARKAGLSDLKVSVLRFSGSPAINDAVLSGNIDIGAFGTPGLLIVWAKTRGHQDILGLAALAAHPFILDTNKPEIKSFTDFGPQDRIAVPATTSPQAILMRMAAEKFYGAGHYARIDPLLVTMPHPDATVALLTGQVISGYVATPPFIAPLRKSDKIHAVIASKEILDGEEASGNILAAAKAFVDGNPKVAKAVIAAIEDAMAFIAKDPDAAADIYIKSESAKIAKPEVLAMLQDGTMLYSVAPTGIMKFATFMAMTGELKSKPKSWEDVFFPLLGGRSGS